MKQRILFLTLLSLIQFLLVHFFLLQGFANSGDEQAYLFQARMLAHGQLYLEDPIYDRENPLNQYVAADALDDTGGRRFSKYDPGWAALLSVGTLLRAEWLVAPLFGALTVFLLLSYVRKRIGDEFVEATWWLITLCAFFLLSVASFGNHTATMAFLFAAFVLYDSTLDETSPRPFNWRWIAVGLLLAFCSLIRYLDWIPLMAWIAFDLLRRRKIKGLILVLLAFGLVASCHFIYNNLLTGNVLLTPAAHDARGNLQARIGISWVSFQVTAIRLWRVVFAFPPILLLLLCLKRGLPASRLKTYLTLFALNVAVYLIYAWTPAGPGPRYYSSYFPFLFLAVVETWRLTREQKAGRIGWRVALAALVVCSGVYTVDQTREIYLRRDLERAVATIPETKRVILLQSGTYRMEIPDLIRNPPDLWSAETLYLAYNDGVGVGALLKRFPDHRVYVYRYPGSLKPWDG